MLVRTRFNSPRADGLSSQEEAPVLFKIEDALARELAAECRAMECGRTTASGSRVFYFYAESNIGFEDAVRKAFIPFPEYAIEFGVQRDPPWSNYLNVLYPSDEQLQQIGNMDVLSKLVDEGDTLALQREVTHWVFFASTEGRAEFGKAVTDLGYAVDEEYLVDGDEPYAVRVSNTHAVTPDIIDKVVLELFRLARKMNGNYDG